MRSAPADIPQGEQSDGPQDCSHPRAAPVDLEWSDVTLAYPHDRNLEVAVQGFTLQLHKGAFLAIVGPSGCGKTSLLRAATGMLHPVRGEVRHGGATIRGINTRVGYVSQKDTVLPWRTVYQNVALPLQLRKCPSRELQRRVEEALELVALTKFGRHYPHSLSGGMLKRVLFARVLVYRPSTLLLDEPFAALDAQQRLILQSELLDIWRRTGLSIALVTHDIDEAVGLADHIAIMSASPGRLRKVMDVDLARPRDLVALRGDSKFAELTEALWQEMVPAEMRG